MAIDKGEHVQAAFLDLSKAYDRVRIPGLIGKLSALGFSRSSLSWLRSFLTNRKQCVCVNGLSRHGSLRSQPSHKGQCWEVVYETLFCGAKSFEKDKVLLVFVFRFGWRQSKTAGTACKQASGSMTQLHILAFVIATLLSQSRFPNVGLRVYTSTKMYIPVHVDV